MRAVKTVVLGLVEFSDTCMGLGMYKTLHVIGTFCCVCTRILTQRNWLILLTFCILHFYFLSLLLVNSKSFFFSLFFNILILQGPPL